MPSQLASKLLSPRFWRSTLKVSSARTSAAFNEAKTDLRFALDAAANEFNPDNDGWVQISPYGSFKHRHGLQVFEKEDADKMVDNFNAGNSKSLGEKIFGIPIYVGHPDADAKAYPDSKAYGTIKELAARNDGLYGRIKLNKFGKEIVEEGVYNSHSPYWNFEPDPKRANVIRPRNLISTGFTNSPNIRETRPFAANEEEQSMNELLKKIALLLALGEAANEADVTAKLNATIAAANELPTIKTKLTETEGKVTTLTGQLAAANTATETTKGELAAANTKVTTLTTERDTAKTEATTAVNAVKTERDARKKTILDAAINTGRVTQAERPNVEKELTEAKDDAAFNSIQERIFAKTTGFNTGKSMTQARVAANERMQPKWDSFHGAVNEKRKAGMKYDDAFNACKAMNEYSGLFADTHPLK